MSGVGEDSCPGTPVLSPHGVGFRENVMIGQWGPQASKPWSAGVDRRLDGRKQEVRTACLQEGGLTSAERAVLILRGKMGTRGRVWL